MKKLKRFALVMCAVLSVTAAAGCGGETTTDTASDDKIEIRIGKWPNKDTDPQTYEIYQGYVEEFAKLRPDVTIIPDEMDYDNNTFTPRDSFQICSESRLRSRGMS